MVLNKYRSNADKILNPLANAFSGLHPNTISAVSLLFAFLAGVALVFSDKSRVEDIFNPNHYIYIMFAIASISIFLNGLLDAVDGKVAKMTKRTSKRGDLFDHTLDRYADILILGGIMLSPFCDTLIGALAIIAVLMTSYMGTQAQALGCGRNYTGLLGRADRLAILILAPVFQMWVLYYYPSGRLPIQYISNFTLIEWVMIWFILAGNITAIHRGYHSWRELGEQEVTNTTVRGRQIFDGQNNDIDRPERNEPRRINLIRSSREERYIQIVRPRPTKIRQPLPGSKPRSRKIGLSDQRMMSTPVVIKNPNNKPPEPRPEVKSISSVQKPKPKSKPIPKPAPKPKTKLKLKPKPKPIPKPAPKPKTKLKLKPKSKTKPIPKAQPKQMETPEGVEVVWDSVEPESKVTKKQRKTKPLQKKSATKLKTKTKIHTRPKTKLKPKLKPKTKLKIKPK